MAPVKTIGRGPSALASPRLLPNGDRRAGSIEKYSLLTPLLREPTTDAHSGASCRKSAVSLSVTKKECSARAATARSCASSSLLSRRYNQDRGHPSALAYWPHFAESTSTKSTSVGKS